MLREVARTMEYSQQETFLCFVDSLIQYVRNHHFNDRERVHLAAQAMPQSELGSDQPYGRSSQGEVDGQPTGLFRQPSLTFTENVIA